ncbi:hybrid sensor histidine kinase/response regulator [Luteimonas sp. 22616]|uniref:hybrid sensor histidine kinase/response regulator n=1 Tax=Luteimonas sp. 22616 TaxID=3453951 RepID=UPI003F82937F
MLSIGVVVLAAVLWLAVMFGTALYGERHPAVLARHWRHVYALSLAVHCTSWSFYGTVTQAARYGWPLPPTFLGAIAFYALAVSFMMRLVRLARETNATSLADLIATRLGKDAWLAAVVTLVAALGLIPYIALQLKAVTMSFVTLTGGGARGDMSLWRDGSLYVALAMALFAMLFGTRRASAVEHNRGLVLAIAFESMFKLVAMLALGAFVWFGLGALPEVPPPLSQQTTDGFAPLVLLGALAMFILPHQFHVGVVECRDEGDVRTARWQFPFYLLLIALPALPLARAGTALLGDSVPSDMYALALPFSRGHEGVALFAFLGGLSAATGMVVVSTLTLSLMIGNHWFAPGLLRGAWSHGGDDGDRRGDVLLLRRVGIAATMLLAWAYSRQIAGSDALADVGAVSFSALATLVPALAFAVWRPQTPARAATAGIVVAFAVWAWVTLGPMLLAATGGDADWLRRGPFGLAWLSPDGLFGLTGWSRLGRAVGASLFCGTLATVLVAIVGVAPGRIARRGSDLQTLRGAGRRFLPARSVDVLLEDAPPSGPVPAHIEARLERELAAVLGSASARLLLDAARREAGPDLDTVAAIVDEASQDLRFNQRVLEGALENMSQGISVVDAQLRLVAWNRRYAELFGYPPGLLQVGRPIADLSRWALQQLPPVGDIEHALQRRLAFMRAGTPHLSERVLPDGSIIEIRGNPMPGGGFVATFTDVTEFRSVERGLRRANETLEQRVGERTALLESAKREAEHANDAKSRFLTAIGHDLMQPLHAAHLFTDTLSQQLADPAQRDAVVQIRGALDSTTDLLTGLFDMSRLEAGGLVPQLRDFPLAEVLEPLASEFRAMAAERGLAFACVPTAAWVRSDPQLLRRVLQNFLANAVRYTVHGGLLLGVRRAGDALRIEVHDTGPGIAPEQQAAIFEEFRRGEDAAGQGLGLGLAIADRIAQLLEAPLALRSRVGRGTVFALTVPRAAARASVSPSAKAGLAGTRVLIVDNDRAALQSLHALLEGWGCEVEAVADGVAAEAAMAADDASLWLFDYHLDGGDTGAALHARLARRFGARPALILSGDGSDAVRRAVHEAGLPLLAKPLKPLALKSVLDRLLAARAA